MPRARQWRQFLCSARRRRSSPSPDEPPEASAPLGHPRRRRRRRHSSRRGRRCACCAYAAAHHARGGPEQRDGQRGCEGTLRCERLRPEENNGRKTRRDEVGGTGAGGLLVGRGAHHELQRAISLRHGKYCDVIAGTRSIVARLPSVGGIEEHPVGADHQRRGPAVRPAAVHPTRRVGSVPAPRA
jgi:hypothetical protein